ncbi:hypothetical protein HMPREF1141_3203 [Clostridium sp. MSTE9]|nr:hypothetical protein HMPREF1141_3203 [Clostridium sp. MSTE9]
MFGAGLVLMPAGLSDSFAGRLLFAREWGVFSAGFLAM